MKALDAVFYETYPDLVQPVTRPHNVSTRLYGRPGLMPLGAPHDEHYSPLLVYRWDDTDAALAGLLEETDGPMVGLEFVNPTTGKPAMPTFSCEMYRLRPGARTAPRRKVGSSIFVVYRGAGSSVINGQRFTWSQGDMFVTPSWSVVEHEATEPSDLFAVSDAPVLKALALYREEEVPGPQEITGEFAAK